MIIEKIDDIRNLRREETHNAWYGLNLVFDKWEIPEGIRHELMFVDRRTFLGWGRDKLMLRAQLNRAGMYTTLHTTLIQLCESQGQVSPTDWLHARNSAYLYGGKCPLESILRGGENTLSNVLNELKRLLGKK